MILKINKYYLVVTAILFLFEALIAYYLKTGFVRHTFGDYLIVILIYCFIKIFIEGYSNVIAMSVWGFAFIIEFSQLFGLIEILNPNNNSVLKLLLGSTFQATDLVAYTLGILTVLIIENTRK